MSLEDTVVEEGKMRKLKFCGFVLVVLESWKNEVELRKVRMSTCCGENHQLIKTFRR